jgi:hypothetical protein
MVRQTPRTRPLARRPSRPSPALPIAAAAPSSRSLEGPEGAGGVLRVRPIRQSGYPPETIATLNPHFTCTIGLASEPTVPRRHSTIATPGVAHPQQKGTLCLSKVTRKGLFALSKDPSGGENTRAGTTADGLWVPDNRRCRRGIDGVVTGHTQLTGGEPDECCSDLKGTRA